MKTSLDPRHRKREEIVKDLFRRSFEEKQNIQSGFARKVLAKQDKIDTIIRQAAPEWPIAQINRVDLAILRLAIYELVIAPREPPKVIIDEAIELAKTFGGEKSPSFVNGALGAVFKNHLAFSRL